MLVHRLLELCNMESSTNRTVSSGRHSDYLKKKRSVMYLLLGTADECLEGGPYSCQSSTT